MACMVLVVAAALGFAGCAKDVKAEDVKSYIQSAEVDGAFDAGYKMTMSFGKGYGTQAEVTFTEEGELKAAHVVSDSLGEMWLSEGLLYFKDEDTKVKFNYESAPTEYEEIKDSIEELKDQSDEVSVEKLISAINEIEVQQKTGAFKISMKKEESGKNVTFKITASGKQKMDILDEDAGEISVKSQLDIVFVSNKLTKFNSKTTMGSGDKKSEIIMNVEAFNGAINLPADADSYKVVE